VSLADGLERAAEALPELADAIRPANGDPEQLLRALDGEQARTVLAWMLAEVPDDAGELALEWAEHDSGVAALSALDEASLPKPARKALRRVRHRLRSRGVELPETPVSARVARLPEAEPEVEGAFVSPLDPGGSRAVVMVVSHPSSGARIFELVTDELRGIRRCEVYKATRGKARRFLKEATEGPQRTGVEVPLASARALVGSIAARQPTDRSLPRTFAEWRSEIAGAPEGTPTPGALAASALSEPTAEDRTRLLALIADGLLGPWPPPEALLRATVEQLEEARNAKIVVAGGRRRERFEEILDEAVEHAYDEGFSALTAARFEESAYVLWKSGREDDARACLSGARAFHSGGDSGGGEEARSNPVARALLERLLAPLLKAAGEEKTTEESESLLVKP